MNKKVFISMLVLTLCFLTGLYVVKIFFPSEFMMVIQNENLIKIGSFIDNHKWLYHICGTITSFITYWLFCCACSQRKYLKWWECLIILGCTILLRIMSINNSAFTTHISISLFFILPFITGGKVGIMALVYSVHGIAQILSLKIRSLPMYLVNVNYLTIFCLGFESYLWLVLLYIIFNYPKKGVKNEKI